MKKHIQALTTNISKNRSAWLMGILNVIASVIIAGGGIDISRNKTEIENSKNTTAILHKRISALESKLSKMEVQIDWLKDDENDLETELRSGINNITIRLDSLSKK